MSIVSIIIILVGILFVREEILSSKARKEMKEAVLSGEERARKERLFRAENFLELPAKTQRELSEMKLFPQSAATGQICSGEPEKAEKSVETMPGAYRELESKRKSYRGSRMKI